MIKLDAENLRSKNNATFAEISKRIDGLMNRVDEKTRRIEQLEGALIDISNIVITTTAVEGDIEELTIRVLQVVKLNLPEYE